MGTALNKILKDFVEKSQTMLGKRAPYVPGWDCHGLPIEYKVVKESRGLSPPEIRKRSEAFARKFVDIQREQFKRLGVFGDWENPYLTMDPKTVLQAHHVLERRGIFSNPPTTCACEVTCMQRFELKHRGEFLRATQLMPNHVGRDFRCKR
jgi:hypothetical protein